MAQGAALLERFSAEFGAPFLLGQRALVGSPLGVAGLEIVRHGLAVHTALVDACDQQVQQAAFFADLTPAPFDEDAGTLLCAAHELFACTHPQASAFYARAHTFARAATHEVQSLARTFDPHRLLTRHLIVERIFAATRTDVRVRWWTGHAEYHGVEAPKRLTAWPSLRRVDIDRSTTPMWKLALASGDDELRVARAALLVALLDASPLTRITLLGDPAQKALGFSLVLPSGAGGGKTSPLDALENRSLARGAVDHLLERGIDVTGSALALSLLQGLREGGPPRILRRAAELCTHLALAACLVEGEASGAREARAVRDLLEDNPAQINEALRIFWAVVGATFMLDGEVFDVPHASDLPQSGRAVVQRMRTRLEHPRVLAVAEPLKRELRRRLPTNDIELPPVAKEARPPG